MDSVSVLLEPVRLQLSPEPADRVSHDPDRDCVNPALPPVVRRTVKFKYKPDIPSHNCSAQFSSCSGINRRAYLLQLLSSLLPARQPPCLLYPRVSTDSDSRPYHPASARASPDTGSHHTILNQSVRSLVQRFSSPAIAVHQRSVVYLHEFTINTF